MQRLLSAVDKDNQKKAVLLISTQIWTDNWVSKHWIAHFLAKRGHEVFFVEPLRGIWVRGGRTRDLFAGPRIRQEMGVNVVSISSLAGFFRTNGLLRKLFRWILKPQLSRLRREIGNDFVILTFDGRSLPLIREFPDSYHSAYYCVDPVGRGEERGLGEERLAKYVDQNIAISEPCAEAMQRDLQIQKPPTVPHAVPRISAELAVYADHDPSCDIRKAQKYLASSKIIGYTGSIHDSYVDFAKVEKAANQIRDVKWLFVGPYRNSDIAENASNAIDRLLKRSDMLFVGSKPAWDLTKYIKTFDVCIVPYRADLPNGWERRSPVKILHYLAQGKPVVCADVPGVRAYRGLIYTYRNYNEFRSALEAALAEPIEGDLQARRKRLIYSRAPEQIFNDLLPLIGLSDQLPK